MVDTFALFVEEFLEDCGAGDGLDDFIDDAIGVVGGYSGVSEFESESAGVAMVGLSGGVVGSAGIDTPGTNAKGREASDSAFVVSCYLWFNTLSILTADDRPWLEIHTKQISIGLPRNDGVSVEYDIAAVSGLVSVRGLGSL